MQYIQNTKYDFIKYKLVKDEIIYIHINMKQNSIFQFYAFVSYISPKTIKPKTYVYIYIYHYIYI